MATAVIGANLSYHNSSALWEMFFRKLGVKVKPVGGRGKSALYNMAADTGAEAAPTGRQIGICSKYSTTTAPTTNTAADGPSGYGDICVYVAANVGNASRVALTSVDIYRCSAYTDENTFTWTKIVD